MNMKKKTRNRGSQQMKKTKQTWKNGNRNKKIEKADKK